MAQLSLYMAIYSGLWCPTVWLPAWASGTSKSAFFVPLRSRINRPMSDTVDDKEFEAAANAFGLTVDDFEKLTINAMKSAFLPYD